LNALKYPNMTAFEGDVKRMIQNAKDFNDRGSKISEDAERIRKLASSYFQKNNPAYKDLTFVSHPTPIPGEEADGMEGIVSTPSGASRRSSRMTRRQSGNAPREVEAPQEDDDVVEAEEEAVEDDPEEDIKNVEEQEEEAEEEEEEVAEEEVDEGGAAQYRGLSFQAAQDKIITDMIKHTEYASKLYRYDHC
jgi:hypothetical protein